jgi:membrane-associated protease RseP (regulator of RpoE activity)
VQAEASHRPEKRGPAKSFDLRTDCTPNSRHNHFSRLVGSPAFAVVLVALMKYDLAASVPAFFLLILSSRCLLSAGDSAPSASFHPMVGIGALVAGDVSNENSISHYVIITQVLPGGPAEGVGLKAQDKIIEVDGIKVAGMSLIDVVEKLIRGAPETEVKITVVRAGASESLTFTVPRRAIMLPVHPNHQ